MAGPSMTVETFGEGWEFGNQAQGTSHQMVEDCGFAPCLLKAALGLMFTGKDWACAGLAPFPLGSRSSKCRKEAK